MALEDYFEFAEPDVIRLKGHRIFLEHIIERWLNGSSPERITQELSTLTLEEVYAAITYYLHNRQELDAYLARAREAGAEQMREADEHPDAVTLRTRALREQQRQEQSTHAH